MNVFATNTTGCEAVARQTISDRVKDAERRAAIHAVQAERRAERRAARKAARDSYSSSVNGLPLWAFRFMRPAH